MTDRLVAWAALIIAVVALLLAWTAYNRSGQDVIPTVYQETQEAAEQTDIAAARVRARADLARLRTELTEERYPAATEQVGSVRADLRSAYQQASGTAQQEWQEIEAGLDRLEQQARDESADALETLAGLLGLLGQDVRVDEQPE